MTNRCCSWHTTSVLVAGLVLLSGITRSVRAQETDSLRTYDLEEIVIGGASNATEVGGPSSSVFRVQLSDLASRDAVAADGLIRLLPGAQIQTNSRGESIATIRAAPERQVVVLLDGVPLTVPWDGRLDLGMLPAALAGGLSVVRGVPGPAIGPNAAAGAIQLKSRSIAAPGRLSEASVSAGTASARSYDGLHIWRGRRGAWLFGGSYHRDAGIPVPHAAELPYEAGRDKRLNTDRRLSSGVVRFDANGQMAASLMHVDSRKGVAPEGHLNPAVSAPRYWRYPEWRNTMLIVGGEPASWLKASTWAGRFQQQIDAFPDASYSAADERQRDVDLTAGLRTSATTGDGPISIRWSTFLMMSQHHQVEADVTSETTDVTSDLEFRSVLASTGLDVAWRPSPDQEWRIGGSIDRMAMPETGDKPSRGAFNDWSARVTGEMNMATDWNAHVSAGRKVRFPTMRELFGDALRRFLLNPELQAEKVWSVETGLNRTADLWSSQIALFLRETTDAIVQEHVEVDGQVKRRRVNRAGSRVWGVEWSGDWSITTTTKVEGHLTWMRPSVDGQHVIEKPEVLSMLRVNQRLSSNIFIQSGLEYTGRAWGLREDNVVIPLPKAAVLNARLSWMHFSDRGPRVLEAFFGIRNAMDALVLPQLGLPGAGRQLRMGVSLTTQG